MTATLLALACRLAAVKAQIPTANVNMVSGQKWPDGDPFLQRQNEPSIAVSTRNPLHLLAGANDYRTVDLPGLPDGEVTGDAWLGVFKSTDGGSTWRSTLIPGYPQDPVRSPLTGYAAAADPMVRAGSNGLFYYSGIAFNRTGPAPTAVFVARFIDNNNKENGDPIAFAGLKIVASNAGTAFIDKPALAVDIPRGRGSCTIQTPAASHATLSQTVPAGAVYLAYTLGTGDEDAPDFQAQIFFTASADCGVTWTAPLQISRPADRINQGASIAIHPRDGTVYVAWRRFSADGLDDGIVISQSGDFGKKFTTPQHVRKFPPGKKRRVRIPPFKEPVLLSEISAFDQPTLADGFRTNAYPTMVVDGGGRVHVAWSERGFAPLAPDPTTGDARIVMATSTPGGGSWSDPQPVDDELVRGHQIMPALSFAAGRLMVVYYDLREDLSQQFRQFIRDFAGIPLRHTIDLRVAQAAPGASPVFGPSVRVSQYIFGEPPGQSAGKVQLQYSPPDLPLFKQGTAPFMGDYIDVAAQSMVPAKNGWAFNTAPAAAPVFHAAWTDNRDVHPPLDGNWRHYTPPNSEFRDGLGGTSLFDASVPAPACQPGQAGMRNQNIYSARITAGLLVAAPGNAKPLSPSLQRGFVVTAQNTTDVEKTFRLTIQNQPPGGRASFSQFPLPPFTRTSPPPLITIDVQIAPRSSISRTVFVTSSDPKAQIGISVVEITALGGSVVASGLQDTVILNPDVSNPDVSNPDVSNPDVSNPDVSNAEVFTPDVSNPDVSNPDVSNPAILNPDVSNPDVSNVLVLNPDVSNPDVSNPDVSNPDVSNPDVSNPDVSNPDVSNASLTDVSWTITNNGNTTAAFSIKLVLNSVTVPQGILTQLLVYRQYTTPVASACDLKFTTQNALIANIPNPTFTAAGDVTTLDPADGSVKNATIYLRPGESARITIRVLDPNKTDNITFNPSTAVVPVAVAQAVDSPKAATGVTTPDVATPPSSGLPVVVGNMGDSGPGSLRQAMLDAEADAGGSHIIFNIPGPGPYTIAPHTPLPTMTKRVVIDGSTQPGYAGAPIILLDGTAAGAGANGLTLTGGSSIVRGLAIGGFAGHGILLQTGGGNQIAGNRIGTNLAGTAPFDLGSDAVMIQDSANNIIGGIVGTTPGGSCTGDCNVIVGRAGRGALHIEGNATSSNANQVLGNFVGTNAAGDAGLGAVNVYGINVIGASNTSIGNNTAAGRNLVSGNNVGILIEGAGFAFAPNTSIAGNYVGPTTTGRAFLFNIAGGIGAGNSAGIELITVDHARVTNNLVSGNGVGIVLSGANTGNVIQGNYVGVDATGGAALNNGPGIVIENGAHDTLVGGTTASARNIISGNVSVGIIVGEDVDSNTVNTQILGNYIGTDVTGTIAIGNGADGIFIDHSGNNRVGGSGIGEGNVIANNAGNGIIIAGASSINNAILSNFIFANAGIGIDLGGDGVTANDGAPDADTGPNNLQNFPTISGSSTAAFVSGSLFSAPNQTYTVQIFANDTPSREGRRLAGSVSITTDGSGFGTFGSAVSLAAGQWVTATATDADGNTSEFSVAVQVF